MPRTLTSALASQAGQTVTIKGFLHNFNNKGKIAFLTIRDRGGLGMIVIENSDEIAKLEGLYTGTVLSVTGDSVLEPMNKKYGVEIKNPTITILEAVHHVHGIDITKDELQLDIDAMIDNRVVTLRHPKQQSIFKIYAQVEKQIRAFFDAHEFTQITSPKLIGFPTEGGAEVFELNYFEKKARLAQSPQFYKQMMVPVFEKLYEIGKAYRAEKSNSSRHLSEILMLDAEMGFVEFEDVIATISLLLNTVVKETRKNAEGLLNMLQSTPPILLDKFPRISVTELHEMYFQVTGEDLRAEGDISSAEEKFICEYSTINRGCEAVIVTGFARSEAKFYHIQNKENPDIAERADLLFRGVEIATLTMRQTNYDLLIKQITDRGFDPTTPGLLDYLDAFKYGMPTSGGFGFGISRLVQKIIGLSNVKEAELFPRDRNRLTP